jgi:signal transduction histidine kinase/ActR/RegA family two-component response regulator
MHRAAHICTLMKPESSPSESVRTHRDSRRRQVLAAQVQLLFSNINVGIGITLIAAAILGRFQWGVVRHTIILGWSLYITLVSAARFILGRCYRRGSPSNWQTARWGGAFSLGAGLAGTGWGAAGILLYPEANLANQVFLIFILGGMMLGGASLLAPRTEAFLAFMISTGLAPVLRLVAQGDEVHLAMGFLASLFVLAMLITTWRIHLTIISSLNLLFENQDLVEDLRATKGETEALNEQLEVRVQERTAQLLWSTQQLQAEIAQREQIEEELLRARKLESLGVLAGGIAHDFNNFLTIVQGNVELAKRQLEPDALAHDILDQTAATCQRAALLSSQLLTFAKGGAPVRSLVSAAKLVMDAVNLVGAGAQVRIQVDIAEDLRSVDVDPGQIGQVLYNILLNARQAMPQGGIIEVDAGNVTLGTDNHVKISVRDYGCGIHANVLPLIFDPYFTTKTDGRGLGLATAYAILARHGGHISVESKPGNGTVFTVDLQASQEDPLPRTEIAIPVQTGTERILVMDDEKDIRKLLETILTELGYEVRTAQDGAEAIALCENAKATSRSFDAVLLDLTVSGGMGGLEAAAKLKKLDPSLKLIVSSGYSDSPVMSDFRKYGFDDIIPKPWAVADLSKVLRRVLVLDPSRPTHIDLGPAN